MPNRRSCASSALAALAVAFLGPGVRAQPPTPAAPNVIVILADDLGYGELGCYGQEKIRTPHVDRLAAEGMRFTRAYSGSPVCAPSRCVLLTGKHTGHAAIRGNREVGGWGPEEPEGQWPLPDSEVTLAERLKPLGYATCVVGKWGLGGPGSEGHPNRQGFDHFYGYLCQRVAHNYYPTHLWRNHDVDVLDGNRWFRAHQRLDAPPADARGYDRYRGAVYAPDEIAAEALGWVRANADGPFYLQYSSLIPHLALQAPEDLVASYPAEWDETPYLGGRGYLPHPRPRAAYAAMITALDRSVGALLDLLDELDIADRTIVLFSSDNGTTYVGGCDRAFFDSLGDLRGHKGTLYEGGIRVPMVVRWPGAIAPGATTDHVCAFQDLTPTVLDLVGARPPAASEHLDGVSFAGVLRGSPASPPEGELYWEHPEGPGWQAILTRDGRWKAVRRGLRNGNRTIQLYDLERDPGETTDLAAERPDLVARFEREMAAARVPSPTFPLPGIDTAPRDPP